jgi:hypothetical protein
VEARVLTSDERAILDLLLTRDFPGRDALLAQAETVRTTGLSCGCGCPSFTLQPERTLPPADAPRMPTDAHGTDPNGNRVGVLLFVKDGYLSEVEVHSWTGSEIAGLPAASDLTLSEWTEADGRGVRKLRNP